MSTTTIARRPSTVANPLSIIERILRDRESIWQQIRTEHNLNSLIRQMTAGSTIALACYGAVLGFSNSALQAITSAIKLPVLFLLTLAICLPTLYLFNLLFGARLSARQAIALVMVAITVTSMLTLAFAPISLFFLITAPDYDFFKVLNVAILTLTGAVGLGFLRSGMHTMNLLAKRELIADVRTQHSQPAISDTESADEAGEASEEAVLETERPVSMGLLNVWIVLYGFVGTQLAWTLRPFFGDPDASFALFRPIAGNFYVNIVRTFFEIFN
jgi:hypothetical protein